jgi:hypothetical protein
MQITSVEALAALPEGAQVQVRSAHGNLTWTWNGTALVRDGTVLDPHLFVGYIDSGAVDRVDNSPIIPGSWFTYGRYTYLCVRYAEDGTENLVCVAFVGGRMVEEVTLQPNQVERFTVIEPWPTALVQPDIVRQVWTYYHNQFMRLHAELAQAREALAKKPERDRAF